MKISLLSRTLTLVVCCALAPLALIAQDAKPAEDAKPAAEPEKKEEAPPAEAEDKDAEAKQDKEREAVEMAEINKKMAVFKSLEGEWTGEEKIVYNKELRRDGKEEVKWKDEWKGFYTNEGRYFEMTGKTKGEVTSTYHWYVTYDTENSEFRAWSFGSNGWGEYTGQLADDSKAVVWEKSKEGEEVDVSDTFELRANGDECKANGETKIVSKDGRLSRNYAKQSSSYTRKKIEI